MGNVGQTSFLRRIFRRIVSYLITIALPVLIICLTIMEGGLRLSGRLPSNTTDGFFEAHNNSYRLKKNISKVVKAPGYSFNVYTNNLGFRDKQAGSRNIGQRPYVLILGESLTFGNGVDYEQSFTGLIGHAIEGQGLEVVNLAVGGHGFIDQWEFFHEIMAKVSTKPEKVLVCFSPLFINGFDRPFTDIVVKNGYLFKKGNWLIPYIRISLGNLSSAYCFFRDNLRKLQARYSDFNKTITQQLLEFYSVHNRLAERSVSADFETRLRELDDYIASLGAEAIFVYVPLSTDFGLPQLIKQSGEDPSLYDVHFYYKLLDSHCKKHGISLINLSPGLQGLFDKGEPLNFIQDAHYNEAANKVIADTILDAMESEKNPLIRSKARQEVP
jgi:hypothetical protein